MGRKDLGREMRIEKIVPTARLCREYRRRYAEEQRQRARLLGRCQNCSKPAILGLSRCEICAEAHRQSRRRSDANRRAAAKETVTAD